MAFMELQCEYGEWFIYENEYGETCIIDHEYMNDIPEECISRVEKQRAEGWCARYSAPGYLDCTDWTGPFETEEEAIEECRALYGDEEDE